LLDDRCVAISQAIGVTQGAALLKQDFSMAGIANLRNLGCGLTRCAETGKKQDAWDQHPCE
jgi:hypothetical protein